ncbi:MAG: acyltransferase [Butyrivibrio sp.]|nr:acyltransferase [Butyrivibrio sp.]
MKRDESIDTLRGIGSFCVMMEHTGVDGIHRLIYSPVMLPIFFFTSGYLLRPEMKVKDFINKRILKLLIPWIIISYVQAYTNISDIRRMLKDANAIKEIGIDCTINILKGTAVWFVPALMVSTIMAYAIMRLCKDQKLVITVSFIVSVFAYFVLRKIEILNIWNINCALINQIFIIVGYYVRHYLDNKPLDVCTMRKLAWATPLFYIAEIAVSIKIFSYRGFNVKMNDIQNIIMYFILCFSGVFAVFALTKKWSHIPLITFMGSHSLLYFAFGSHGYIFGRKLLELLPFDISGSAYALIICIIACIAWIIPALIIDRVCPILNGGWSWDYYAKRNK